MRYGRGIGRVVVASAILVLVLLSGCSQAASTRDDLDHALVEAHSALVAARMALDTLDQDRTTSAATETALDDMGQQIADAARALEPVTVGSEQDQRDRDLAFTVISSGETALLTARDQLSARGHADPVPLVAATMQVDGVLEQIRLSQ